MTFPFYPSLLVDVIAVVPYSRNSRTHSVDQIKQIARSIQEFGFTNPVLLDANRNLIAGHGRLEAARLLNIPQIPAITLPHLSDAQKQALRIADNRIALSAGWDDALLHTELGDLRDAGFDLALTGFDEMELSDMLDDPGFGPVGSDEQGRLDERAPVTCPHCGHSFSPA